MRLNAFKLIINYFLLTIAWFLLSRGLVLVFKDKLSEEIIENFVAARPFCFVLFSGLFFYEFVKLSNKRIDEKEQDSLSLYLANPNPLWIYDLESLKFLSVNEAAIAVYGYSREEFLSMTIKDIRKPQDHEKLVTTVNQLKNKTNISGIWQHLKKDGSLIYVHITSQKIKHQKKDCVMVFAADTTERIEYEQELKLINQRLNEEKQKLQQTEKLARVSGWEYYIEDDLLIWSDELYQIFDVDKASEKMDYRLVLKSIHIEDLSAYNQAIENLLKQGKNLDIEYRFITKNGVVRYANVLGKMQYSEGKMFKVQGTMQDVTELKLAEIEKNKYQQHLKITLNNITDCYFQLNRNWIITAVNKNFENLVGIKQENLVNQHYFELFPDGKDLKFYSCFKKVLEEGVPVNFEEFSLYIRRWLCLNAYPTEDGAAVYFSDITESKEKDLQLKEALERYDLVAKATKDVIYDWDVLNDKIKYGRTLGNLLEMPEQEHTIVDFSWWKERVHPDDLNRVRNIYEDAIIKKQTNCGAEYRIKTSSGQYKYVYDQGYLQYNEQQQFVRMIGALKDIDELKRFDKENKRLADIITKVNNMIIIQNENHKITWVNKAFENFTGYTLSDVFGKVPHAVLAGPETDFKALEKIVSTKKTAERFAVEVINYTKQGKKYWVNIEFTPLFTADGKPEGYISIHTDITQQKEKSERISRQNEILRNIAWISSHELRRPVASILGLLELVKTATDEAEKIQSIEMMDTCTKNLDEIVHQINDKIEQEIAEQEETANVKVV